jgi:GDP-4-dehydro-6-deoxy-D-mannose reductase
MRVFITGACGFAGRHLVHELTEAGHEPFGFGLEPPPGPGFCPVIQGDILKPDEVAAAVREIRPEAGVHLAAMAAPADAASRAALMAAVNIQGTVHVLEAFRREAPRARLLAVSSARIYGSRTPPAPIREDEPPTPDSLYAITKEAADRLALQYAADFHAPFLTARPHNHTGPGQGEAFSVGSFAAQFRRMAAGLEPPVLKIGNPDSARDFLDVRDVVRAYRLLLEKGQPGLAYNIASGRSVSIGEIIAALSRITGLRPEVRIEPARYRPADFSAPLDTTRLAEHTGWRPRLTLDETLRDMVAV